MSAIISTVRASAWKYACYLCAALAVAAVLAFLFVRADAAASARRADAAESRAQTAEGALHQAQHVIEVERKQADAANQVAANYEKERNDAQSRADRLTADLRAGTVRLREPWRTCPAVPEAGAAAGEPHDATDHRAESAGRVVRAADDADAQIRALQEFIRTERKP